MNLVALKLLGLFLIFQTPYTPVPIKEAIRLVPRDNMIVMTNRVSMITGIVTSSSGGNGSALECFVQDQTGGIRLFQYENNGSSLSVGDSVIAVGKLALYYGQEEIVSPRVTVIRHGVPVILTEASATQINSGELHGRLVHCEGKVVRKITRSEGVSFYFVDSNNDTASGFIDRAENPEFDVDQIHTGSQVSIVGVVSRYSYKKPFTNNNDVIVRSSMDLVPLHVDFLERYLTTIVTGIIVVLGIVILLIFFNYLLRLEVRQKTRQIEEQAKLSSILYNSIAELSGLLDKDEIITRTIKRMAPLMGSTSTVFCELMNAEGGWTLTSMSLVNDEIVTETERFKSAALAKIMDQLASTDALWNTSIGELVSAEMEGDLFAFLSRHLRGVKVTVLTPLANESRFFVIFDHTRPLSEKFQQALILSYAHHLYSAILAADLFTLTKKKEAAIEKLYNNSVFGLLTIAADGSIETANQVASHMLNDSELVGKKIQDYLAPEDARRLVELLPSLATIATEKFVRFEAKTNPKCAATPDIEFAMEFDLDSKTFQVSAQDIGDRRVFENYSAYEQKIETLEKLASFLSHDLNNIVGSMMGYASLLKRKLSLDSKEHHYADIIEGSSKRMTELVKQVLGFAQMDTKTIEVVDLNMFVNDTAADFAKTHGDKYSVLTTRFDEPVYVRVSTSQFRQVMLAVLENAAESMENGGTIRCSTGISEVQGETHGFTHKGVHCFVEIEDHGIGMDEAIKRRIFEPFFTTKRIKKYTGLSLSAAFNIIKHHKGSISVDSTPGVGTRVRIYLPRYSEKETVKGEPTSSETFGAKGTKVMVVDDEESVRQLGCDILNEHGYTVITASDGLQALARLKENPDVRLVVLDMVMPGMGGKDTCIEIKRMPKPPKVLICTGFSELSDLETVLGTYSDGLLQKPYSTSDLVASVGSLLRSSSSERA